MISVLALSALLAIQPELGPLCPPGSSAHFQAGVKHVSTLLSESKFDEAKRALARLPKTEITYRIDFTNVPAADRPVYEAAILQGIEVTRNGLRNIEVKPVNKQEDILLTFVDKLPVDPESTLPQGLVTFLSHDPAEPAVEAVVALNRLSTQVPIEPGHVRAEFLFALGEFLGLARTPGIQGISKRTDTLMQLPPIVVPREMFVIRKNLEVVETLAKAVADRKPLRPAETKSTVDIARLEAGTVPQGNIPEFNFGVYNEGNAPLEFWIEPDCSCFRIITDTTVQPGSSSNVRVWMDTSAFVGPQHKRLYIYTNDPENPLTVVEVTAVVRPAYRFISDGPPNPIVYLEDNGAKAEIFLAVDPAQPINPHSVKISGATGTAVFEPWSGELPDPQMNEGPQARQGYKITVLFAPQNLEGQSTATLSVTTDNDQFKTLNHNFRLQRGVAVSPKVIYFGEAENGPNRAFTVLSQPGRPFKITKTESRSPHLTVTHDALPNGDVKVNVAYDGKGLPGTFSTSVFVYTDSAHSPKIEIPVQGVFK